MVEKMCGEDAAARAPLGGEPEAGADRGWLGGRPARYKAPISKVAAVYD